MLMAFFALFIYYELKRYWKNKVSTYIKLVLLFDTLYFISTYINIGLQINILTYALKKFVILCWIEYIILHKEKRLLSAMANALWTLIIFDFISIVLYPEGLSAFGIFGWVLGGKNNRFCYVFLASLLSIISWYQIPDKKKNKMLFKLAILETIAIVSVVLVKSSTSTVSVCLLVGFIFLYPVLKSDKFFNMYTYIISHSVIWVSITLYNAVLADKLSEITGFLVGKDATFTGRTPIWNAVLDLIKEKPLWGYGEESISANVKRTGISYFLNTHNQVLELLYTGGALLLITFLIILVLCLMRNHKKKSVISIFASWSIFALLFEFTQEAIMLEFLLWVILLFVYHANELSGIDWV